MAQMSAEPTSTLVEGTEISRKRWTRSECRQLMDLGILEEARFELIHGEIILKMTQHERHVFTCQQVQRALEAIFGSEYVRMAAPIAIADHEEPEPDAAVMTHTGRDYLRLGTPPPEDVRLAVEVSDSTLRFDRTVKRGQYASAGIPEYWIVDINARALHVLRQPLGGDYTEEQTVTVGDTIRPLAAPAAAIAIADLLP